VFYEQKSVEIPVHNSVGLVWFLAHLAQSAKVSFWDDPLSVVRRRRRRRRPSSVVNNLLKHLLL